MALAAVRGGKTLAELAQQFDGRPNPVTQWRSRLLDGAVGLFGAPSAASAAAPTVDVKTLHAEIGELTLADDSSEVALDEVGLSAPDCRRPIVGEHDDMIDRAHDLPIMPRARALGISRGSIHYRPRPVFAADLSRVRRIDELHLELPFAGSRMRRDLLAGEGIEAGRLHVATLMQRMGIEAL